MLLSFKDDLSALNVPVHSHFAPIDAGRKPERIPCKVLLTGFYRTIEYSGHFITEKIGNANARQSAPRARLAAGRRGARHCACRTGLSGYAGFSQTETCVPLSLVNGSRLQSLQRSRKLISAICAMRSSSAGHT